MRDCLLRLDFYLTRAKEKGESFYRFPCLSKSETSYLRERLSKMNLSAVEDRNKALRIDLDQYRIASKRQSV